MLYMVTSLMNYLSSFDGLLEYADRLNYLGHKIRDLLTEFRLKGMGVNYGD